MNIAILCNYKAIVISRSSKCHNNNNRWNNQIKKYIFDLKIKRILNFQLSNFNTVISYNDKNMYRKIFLKTHIILL